MTEFATRSDKVTGFVGEPSYVMTELLASYAVDHLQGKGKVAMLSGWSGLDLTKLRVNGFKDYLSKYPGMKVVAEKFTSTASSEALSTMQDYLQAYPDIKVVYAFNGPIAIGAVQALRAAGKKPGDVMVLTTDMETETQRLINDGWIQATIVSQPVTMAELAVQRAVEAAEGKKIPKETLTQASLVSKETVNDVDLSGQEVPKKETSWISGGGRKGGRPYDPRKEGGDGWLRVHQFTEFHAAIPRSIISGPGSRSRLRDELDRLRIGRLLIIASPTLNATTPFVAEAVRGLGTASASSSIRWKPTPRFGASAKRPKCFDRII